MISISSRESLQNEYNAESILDSEILEFKEHIKIELNISLDTNINYYIVDPFQYKKGTESESLYIIEYEDTKLFLKTGISEISRITKTSNFIREHHPELESEWNLILPILVGKFNGGFYELLPLAKGNTFEKLISQYMEGQISLDYLQKCYFNLGQTISHIHLTGKINDETNLNKLRTSLAHGDLHDSNIFCYIDENGKPKVTLIDNSRISRSIEYPSYVSMDVMMILRYSGMNVLKITTDIESEKDYIKILVSFFNGYLTNVKDLINVEEYLTSILLPEVLPLYQDRFELEEFLNEVFPDVQKGQLISKILGEYFPVDIRIDDF